MRKLILTSLVFFTCTLVGQLAFAEDGYEMWLRYQPVADAAKLKHYRQELSHLVVENPSPTLTAATHELKQGLQGLLGVKLKTDDKLARKGSLIIGTPANSPLIAALNLSERLAELGPDGFLIEQTKVQKRDVLVIAANNDVGALYGAFHLLRLIQTEQSL
jgi:alpha-glucuronidase